MTDLIALAEQLPKSSQEEAFKRLENLLLAIQRENENLKKEVADLKAELFKVRA